jgi:hypothetical protein
MLSELTESGKFRIHWLIGHLAPTLIVNRITGQHYRVIAEDAPPSGLPPSPYECGNASGGLHLQKINRTHDGIGEIDRPRY